MVIYRLAFSFGSTGLIVATSNAGVLVWLPAGACANAALNPNNKIAIGILLTINPTHSFLKSPAPNRRFARLSCPVRRCELPARSNRLTSCYFDAAFTHPQQIPQPVFSRLWEPWEFIHPPHPIVLLFRILLNCRTTFSKSCLQSNRFALCTFAPIPTFPTCTTGTSIFLFLLSYLVQTSPSHSTVPHSILVPGTPRRSSSIPHPAPIHPLNFREPHQFSTRAESDSSLQSRRTKDSRFRRAVA